jgi:hypothetical protein
MNKRKDISNNETAQHPTAEERERMEKRRRLLEGKARGKAWGDACRAERLAQRSAPMPPAAAAPIFTSPAKPKLPKTKLTAAQQRQRAREWAAAQQGYIQPPTAVPPPVFEPPAPVPTATTGPSMLPKTKLTAAQQRQRAREWAAQQGYIQPPAAVPPPVFEPPAPVPTATTGPMFMPFINLEPSSPIPSRFSSAAPAPALAANVGNPPNLSSPSSDQVTCFYAVLQVAQTANIGKVY